MVTTLTHDNTLQLPTTRVSARTNQAPPFANDLNGPAIRLVSEPPSAGRSAMHYQAKAVAGYVGFGHKYLHAVPATEERAAEESFIGHDLGTASGHLDESRQIRAVHESFAETDGGAKDAELVCLAQGGRRDQAVVKLLDRHRNVIHFVIRRVVIRNRLSREAWPDLWQEAAVAMLEAVAKYDPGHIGRRGGACFRTFLSRVLERHFYRWAQKHWRAKGGWQRRLRSAAEAGTIHSSEIPNRPLLSPTGDPDPEAIAEEKERAEALQRALADLDDWRRRLWDSLAVGMSLREIAMDLGLSYETVKRERRKLLRWLKARLRPFQD